MKSLSLIFGLAIITMCACQSQLSPTEYSKHVRSYENGLHKKREVAGVVVDLQYKPSEYVLLNEYRGKIPNTDVAEKRLAQLADLEYYTLKIGTSNKSDILQVGLRSEEEYYDKQYYLSFGMQQDIRMVTKSGEVVPCQLFHYEKAYDMGPDKTIVLAFDRQAEDRTIEIDSPLLGSGLIKVNFKQVEIESVPQLDKNS